MPAPALTYFTVVRTIFPQPSAVLCADVTFKALVPRGVALQANIPHDIIEILTRPVTARIEQGVLVRKATPGVQLLAADEVSIEGGFWYRADFTNVTINSQLAPSALLSLTFEALTGTGTLDLKDAYPVTVDDIAVTQYVVDGGTP